MYLLVKGTRQPLAGELRVPTSKYHAHRALILASLAEGTSRIHGLSDARHVHYTVQMLRGLGTRVEVDGDTFVVDGGAYAPRRASVSAGSSGSTLYFLTGLASLASAPVTITGQKYLQRRPIGPLLQALRQMGVRLEADGDRPPIHVQPVRPSGGRVTIAGTLSQWISGLIMLAPFASGPTAIEVEGDLNERTYLELTLSMMRRFGLEVGVSPDWRRFEIDPGQRPVATDLSLPPDIGSAAFGVAAAAIHPGDVLLRGMSTLTGDATDHPEMHFLEVARELGVPMELDEAAGGMRIRHDGAVLRGTTVDCRDLPDMLPILSTLGTFARGETVLENIAHVRLKESDRVSAMLQLNAMGGRLELDGERLRVRGVDSLVGSKLSSFNDHRVLMSLAVAASRATGRTTLTYPAAYRISYPTFLESMNDIGIPMSVEGRGAPASRSSRSARARSGAARPQPTRPDAAGSFTVGGLVRRWARERPGEPAVIDIGTGQTEVVTWAELDDRIDRVATQLLRLGVQPGERVAAQLPNWAEFVVVALATLRVGAVCCPLMPIFREHEVAFMLARSRARVLFVPREFRGRRYAREVRELVAASAAKSAASSAAPAGDRSPAADLALEHVVVLPGLDGSGDPGTSGVTWHDWDELLAGARVDSAALGERAPTADMTAQLLFTSGTSGEPKGVPHRHETLNRAAAMEVRHLGLGREDVVAIPSPLAHQTGFLYGMWLALVLGVPQIVQAVWEPTRALRALTDHGGSFIQAATPFLADLVKAVEGGGSAPPGLRIFVATGAAIPRGLAERATRLLGTAVCGAFGTTETCLGALSAPGDEPAKVWGTDGRALDGIRLRITDDGGQALPAQTEGNFEIFSPTVFDGYLGRPDLTAETFTEDGWYRTGDLGIIDETGFIRITGRVKDVINRGGEKVPVAEVEQVLYEHPSVDDVAVVAMPDDRLGERACAFVVLAAGMSCDFESMQKFLDSHQISKHYWPERLEFLDALPRNATGKVQKFVLRERARSLRSQRDEETTP